MQIDDCNVTSKVFGSLMFLKYKTQSLLCNDDDSGWYCDAHEVRSVSAQFSIISERWLKKTTNIYRIRKKKIKKNKSYKIQLNQIERNEEYHSIKMDWIEGSNENKKMTNSYSAIPEQITYANCERIIIIIVYSDQLTEYLKSRERKLHLMH